MIIEVGYDLVYDVPEPTHFLLMLYVHPDANAKVLTPDEITTDPSVPVRDFIDQFGNRCARIMAPQGRIRLTNRLKIEVPDEPEMTNPDAEQHPVDELPDDVLQFLLGSRYCEVQELSEFAWETFGNGLTGWKLVDQISNWVHENVRYDSEYARPDKTAMDVWKDRTGVCRDYTHLAITLCRCLNIPARYATGYLGDFGVPYAPPMDFSAFFEAYVGGKWYPFDSRNNQARIGRVLMGRGRDAVDVALTTSFGPHELVHFEVITDEVVE
jgi:transglutaminase-like putative cysteine protease